MDVINDEQPAVNAGFARRKVQQFSPFLSALFDAFEYASDLALSPWEFSLAGGDAFEFDVKQLDLRWMVRRGWIQHRIDPIGLKREPKDFGVDSQYIIANAGVEALGRFGELQKVEHHDFRRGESSCPPKPCWDCERHELTFSGRVVKRFRWPASNQEAILAAFEEEHWPAKIDDPLPPGSGLDPKRRLGDTIKCLNRNQYSNLIRFRGDGTGEGVLWDTMDSFYCFQS